MALSKLLRVFRAKLSTFTPAEILSGGNANVAYDKISKLVGVAEAALYKDVETFASLRESAKEHVFGMGQVAGIVQVVSFLVIPNKLLSYKRESFLLFSGPVSNF